MADKENPPQTPLTAKQQSLMSQRLARIAELEAARAKVADLNKKLFDAGFRVDRVCW